MDTYLRAASVGPVEVEGCDTIPKLFEHQVRARGAPNGISRKAPGHLASHVVARLR